MPVYLYAQVTTPCENTKRTYADFQGSIQYGFKILGGSLIMGTISDAPNAVNGQVKDASTLGVGLGLAGLASSTQFLQFSDVSGTGPRSIPANTPVTIKISLPTEVLSVLSGVEIGSFTGLQTIGADWPFLGIIGPGHDAGYTASSMTPIYNSTNIAGVISGSGEVEITLTPGQLYNGIYVKVSGNLLSVALSAKLFHAYIMETTTAKIDCDEVIDVLSGVQPTIIGGVLNATGKVTDPFNAIDSDKDSYALMDVGASVLNKIFLTAIFNKPSQPRDSVSIILGKPGGGLLSLNLLTGFTIQPYLNGAKAGAAFDNTGTFLNLKLFPGATDQYVLTFPISQVYDRLEITTGGLAGVLGSLRVYDIKRKLAKPRTLIDPVAEDSRVICEGGSTTFEVNNPQDCTEYKWYDAETGGNLLHTGLAYTPTGLVAGNYNYYVQSSRTYCITAVSERLRVKLKVNPLPTLTVAGATICNGSSTVLAVTSPDAGFTYNWYTSSSGGAPFNVGTSYTTPALTTTTTYYVEAVNTFSGCKNAGGARAVEVKVKQYAPVPAITGVTTMCGGTSTTLTNVYPNGTWSSSDAGIATVNAGGLVNAVSAGNVVISYTVADDVTYCAKKVDFNLTVNPQPNLTLMTDPGICEGLSTTKITYTNPVFNPITYSISWMGGLLPAVSNQTLPANEITITIPSSTPVAVYQGILTIKNANGCEQAIPFNFRVKLVPHKPTVSIN
ncbi:Ig-like domain-containing protein [Pedobacter miscanthi]|uniref:Ig-like domain-containing protein n=1 Tax=Pedobacter miscanthi TaxID=2259170 RepID=UPI00292CC7FB|nr:Ig-like domain-containing protein [Pedobacter miscanthi]